MDKKLCKCGCGEEVKLGNSYIHGHNRRGIASFTSNGRWARNYSACLGCGTVEVRHKRDGHCSNCARKKLYSGEWAKKRDLTGGLWAKKHTCCIGCGTTERPHQAKGLCGRCWQEKRSREMGRPKKNFGGWSWYSDCCSICKTTESPHYAKGMCYDCYEENKRLDKGVGLKKCPVCGVGTERLQQHISMKSKKCSKHLKYYNRIYSDVVESFRLNKTSEEVSLEFCVSKNRILKIWHENFTKKEIQDRGERIRVSKISGENNYLFGTKGPLVSNNLIEFTDVKGRFYIMRSTWEVKYARYLDHNKIEWEYEEYKFKYYSKDGSPHYYFPDFYLPAKKVFIEIKGFMDDFSRHKIEECSKRYSIKIKILHKADLIKLGINI